METKEIKGAVHVDDRGEVSFVNDFDFDGVKRFYTIRNHRVGFVRAWHAHKREEKYVTVLSGSALLGIVEIDDWDKPSKDADVSKFILSAKNPSVLAIPQCHANGMMTLSENTIITVFSTSTLDESLNDDVRYDSRYWDIWNVEER
tara:strand:+ start:739 stop:1176 length:438 start_codon:yes stop_codon:yes gene_type:complete